MVHDLVIFSASDHDLVNFGASDHDFDCFLRFWVLRITILAILFDLDASDHDYDVF